MGILNKGSAKKKSISLIGRISFKLSLFSTLGILVTGIFTVAFMSFSSFRLIHDINLDQSKSNLQTMLSLINDYEEQSASNARVIANDEAVEAAVEKKSYTELKAAVENLLSLDDFNVDFITITDDTGTVIARSHSDKTGDSVVNQKNIANALNGQVSSQIEQGTEILLSVRTGYPLKNADGKIMGVISTGYSFVKTDFVDKLKAMTGNEYSIFLSDERINTTITDNGERVIGTRLDPNIAEIVLNKGEDYIGTTKFLDATYLTAYTPIRDGSNQIIGALFTGVSLSEMHAAIAKCIIISALIVLLLIVIISLIFNFILKKISSLLDTTLSVINETALQVSTSAEQVSTSSQGLAAGASEQSATVEELAASAQNIAEQAVLNVSNVKKATEYVWEADEKIKDSNLQVQSLCEAMNEIRTSSQKISFITSVIEDIAFQTNILALNAAIEAARSGAAGKGFAVVADEVRNLAAKSTQAAKETTELIFLSNTKVLEGNKFTDAVAQLMIDVAKKAEQANQAIQQIETCSAEQSVAIEQIMIGLSQVSDVIQHNAASAEESSAASEDMATQAQMLKKEVGKFNL